MPFINNVIHRIGIGVTSWLMVGNKYLCSSTEILCSSTEVKCSYTEE